MTKKTKKQYHPPPALCLLPSPLADFLPPSGSAESRKLQPLVPDFYATLRWKPLSSHVRRVQAPGGTYSSTYPPQHPPQPGGEKRHPNIPRETSGIADPEHAFKASDRVLAHLSQSSNLLRLPQYSSHHTVLGTMLTGHLGRYIQYRGEQAYTGRYYRLSRRQKRHPSVPEELPDVWCNRKKPPLHLKPCL